MIRKLVLASAIVLIAGTATAAEWNKTNSDTYDNIIDVERTGSTTFLLGEQDSDSNTIRRYNESGGVEWKKNIGTIPRVNDLSGSSPRYFLTEASGENNLLLTESNVVVRGRENLWFVDRETGKVSGKYSTEDSSRYMDTTTSFGAVKASDGNVVTFTSSNMYGPENVAAEIVNERGEVERSLDVDKNLGYLVMTTDEGTLSVYSRNGVLYMVKKANARQKIVSADLSTGELEETDLSGWNTMDTDGPLTFSSTNENLRVYREDEKLGTVNVQEFEDAGGVNEGQEIAVKHGSQVSKYSLEDGEYVRDWNVYNNAVDEITSKDGELYYVTEDEVLERRNGSLEPTERNGLRWKGRDGDYAIKSSVKVDGYRYSGNREDTLSFYRRYSPETEDTGTEEQEVEEQELQDQGSSEDTEDDSGGLIASILDPITGLF